MNLFAKFDDNRTLTGVCACISATSNFSLKITNTVTDNKINVGGTLVPFDKFLKNLKSFTISASGTISFRQGETVSGFDDSIIETPDMSVPMAYTRANTIVNFGSL